MMPITDAACAAALRVWFGDLCPEMRERVSRAPALISRMRLALIAAHDPDKLCMEGSAMTQITDDELLRIRDVARAVLDGIEHRAFPNA